MQVALIFVLMCACMRGLKTEMMVVPKGKLVAVCETDGWPKTIKYSNSRKDLCGFKHTVEAAKGHPQLSKDLSLHFCWASSTSTKYQAVACWVEADQAGKEIKRNKGKSSPKRLDFFVHNPLNKGKTTRLSRVAGLIKFKNPLWRANATLLITTLTQGRAQVGQD